MIFVGRWGESFDAQDWWVAAAMACLLCLIPLFVYIAALPQLLRLDESTIRSVTFRCGRCRRFTTRWSDVEQFARGEQGVWGIAAHGQRIALNNAFAKEDRELLHAEVEARLAPYFDFDAPTEWDRRYKHRSLKRRIGDFTVAMACGLTTVALISAASALTFVVPQWIALVAVLAVFAIVFFLVLRLGRRHNEMRWHHRVGSVADSN